MIFQLIRRKKLKEQYSLLWFLIVAVMLILAIWDRPLAWISEAMGIQLLSNTLFVLAILFLFGMALHFSLLVSRLTDQSKMLSQRLALLDRDLRLERGRHEAIRSERPAADMPTDLNPHDERD